MIYKAVLNFSKVFIFLIILSGCHTVQKDECPCLQLQNPQTVEMPQRDFKHHPKKTGLLNEIWIVWSYAVWGVGSEKDLPW